MCLAIIFDFPPLRNLSLDKYIRPSFEKFGASFFHKNDPLPNNLQARHHIDYQVLNSRKTLHRIVPDSQMRKLIQHKNTFQTSCIFNSILMQVQNLQFS